MQSNESTEPPTNDTEAVQPILEAADERTEAPVTEETSSVSVETDPFAIERATPPESPGTIEAPLETMPAHDVVPLSLPTDGVVAQEVLTEVPKKHRRLLVPAISILAIGLVVIITLVVWTLIGRYAPNVTFEKALTSTLSTPQVAAEIKNNNLFTTTNYDLTTPTQPVLSTKGTIAINGTDFTLSGYGTLQNTFFEYTGVLNSQLAPAETDVLNKWVQLRTNGDLQPGINASIATFSDPRTLLFGNMLFGDFSKSTSLSLAKSLIDSHVYSYNIRRVSHIKSGGQVYYEYPITLNLPALKAWNLKMASIIGLSPSAISATITAIDSEQSANGLLYIDKATNQLVRFDLTEDGKTTIALYTYAHTAPVSQPQTYVSWTQFVPLENQLEAQAAHIQTDAELDSERKADITELQHYIEAYFAANGKYPTLSDMNSQVWVSVNMQGINPDVFKDPQGSSLQLATKPGVDVYAYEPLGLNGVACNDTDTAARGIPCQTYKLIATLSSGQTYAVQNIS